MRFSFQRIICALFFQSSYLCAATLEVEYGIAIPIPDEIVMQHIRPLEDDLYKALGKNTPVPNIPHITLFQLRTTEDKLPQIIENLHHIFAEEAIKALFQTPFSIHLNIPYLRSGTGDHMWISLHMTDKKVLPLLMEVHQAVSKKLSPLRTGMIKALQDTYETLPGPKKKYVNQMGFVGGIFYTPHMTLFYNADHDVTDKIANKVAYDFTKRSPPLHFSFQVQNIVVGELGEEGNMTKVLHTFPMRP